MAHLCPLCILMDVMTFPKGTWDRGVGVTHSGVAPCHCPCIGWILVPVCCGETLLRLMLEERTVVQPQPLHSSFLALSLVFHLHAGYLWLQASHLDFLPSREGEGTDESNALGVSMYVTLSPSCLCCLRESGAGAEVAPPQSEPYWEQRHALRICRSAPSCAWSALHKRKPLIEFPTCSISRGPRYAASPLGPAVSLQLY